MLSYTEYMVAATSAGAHVSSDVTAPQGAATRGTDEARRRRGGHARTAGLRRAQTSGRLHLPFLPVL